MLSPFVVCGGLAQGGLGFGKKISEQPHPAPVWPKLPLRVKMIWGDGPYAKQLDSRVATCYTFIGHSDSKQGRIVSRLPLLRVSVLFSPSAKATEQFVQLALYSFHGWFVHVHLNLGLCQLAINHRRNHSLQLCCKRIDRGVSVFRVFLNMSLVERVITGRNHCPQLLLVLDHRSSYIKLIHENLSFYFFSWCFNEQPSSPITGCGCSGKLWLSKPWLDKPTTGVRAVQARP